MHGNNHNKKRQLSTERRIVVQILADHKLVIITISLVKLTPDPRVQFILITHKYCTYHKSHNEHRDNGCRDMTVSAVRFARSRFVQRRLTDCVQGGPAEGVVHPLVACEALALSD